MGQLKKLSKPANPSPDKSVVNLLQQLSQELDLFFEKPDHYPREKIIDIAKSFLNALAKTIDEKALVKSESWAGINFENLLSLSNWLKWMKRARHVLQSDEVDDYGCDPAFELAIKPFFDFLYTKYFRVTTKGIENIPTSGRGLIVANHSGVLPYDAAMMKVSIFNEHSSQRDLRFLVDDFVFHFPFLGIFMNRIGGVRACPENAERLLTDEELVSVFPEGIKGISKHFTDRYRLQRFGRGGVIRLALKTRAPIIPTAIIGAEEIHPLVYKSSVLARPLGFPFIPITPTFPLLGPLGMIPLPTKWTISFGPPISFADSSDSDQRDGILINRKTEELRNLMQTMVFDLLKERRSIFWG